MKCLVACSCFCLVVWIASADPCFASWDRPAFVSLLDRSLHQRTNTKNNKIFVTRETPSSEKSAPPIDSGVVGLYRPFVEHAWSKLQSSGLVVPKDLPKDLALNSAPAKGMPADSVVQMSIQAMVPNSSNADDNSSAVRYARYALLETLVPPVQNDDSLQVTNSTSGIQVLNLVIFPSTNDGLPVWGVDLVSLPGGRHLLAMDVQPMSTEYEMDQRWEEWHKEHVQDVFPWGGDVPEDAAFYFSENALWTRLRGDANATSIIQTKVWNAFCEHLDLYLDLLLAKQEPLTKSTFPNRQEQYLEYRLHNDPARPMLQSLYGAEWTEKVLGEILFPSLK